MSLEPVAYIRGGFVSQAQAALSILDQGIVLGATVTEMLRTFKQEPFRAASHARRFEESCRYARIDFPGREDLAEVTTELVAHNARVYGPGRELGVIWFATPGDHPVYAMATGGSAGGPTLCVHSFPLPFAAWRGLFSMGAHLVTPPTRHVPPQCVDPKAKNRSRLHWWIAEKEAKLVDPEATSVLLDLEGNLTEASGANVLLVKDGVVLSPTPRNILLGVSREMVIELCGELGLRFLECDLQIHDAINADEILLTSTPYCIAPVTRFNGVTVGSGRPGPVFDRLLAAWSKAVDVDIRAQVFAQ